MGDTRQAPYCQPKNIRQNCSKFSRLRTALTFRNSEYLQVPYQIFPNEQPHVRSSVTHIECQIWAKFILRFRTFKYVDGNANHIIMQNTRKFVQRLHIDAYKKLNTKHLHKARTEDVTNENVISIRTIRTQNTSPAVQRKRNVC
jgi:hypothetical protein